MKKVLLALMMCLVMLLTACSAGNTESEEPAGEAGEASVEEAESSVSVDYAIKYYVKINPEFVVYADENLNVVAVEAVNEDAENVLASVDINGMNVTEAFDTLATEAQTQGYMTEEKGNTVDISIEEIKEEVLVTCPVCIGSGTVECWDCHGAGGFTCELCQGVGTIAGEVVETEEWVPCSQCGGSGIMNDPDEGCWACHGSGICYDCEGTGYDIVTNEFGEVVYTEEGTPETSMCEFCKGSGICTNCIGRACNRCNYDGAENPGYEKETHTEDTVVECPDCQGTGIIYCGCDLNGYRWCPCCWGSGVDGTGYENYDYNLSPEENWENNR